MRANNPDRRRFLTRALLAGSAVLLAGCDKLSRTEWFPRILGTAENLNYRVQHLIAPRDALAREFTEADISAVFPGNGTRNPQSSAYQALAQTNFSRWRLRVDGLVEQPASFSLTDLRGFDARTQITRHDCVEGWSAIGKWTGVPLSKLLEQVRPTADARFVVFHCADPMDNAGHNYYESIDMHDAYHPQTILAYELNDEALPVLNGAPLRARVERQLGYKSAKYLMRIELVDSFADIERGNGGYWEDEGYEWYAGI